MMAELKGMFQRLRQQMQMCVPCSVGRGEQRSPEEAHVRGTGLCLN